MRRGGQGPADDAWQGGGGKGGQAYPAQQYPQGGGVGGQAHPAQQYPQGGGGQAYPAQQYPQGGGGQAFPAQQYPQGGQGAMQHGGQPPVDFNNPMFQMAASSGAQFFDQGHSMLQKNVEQYVSMGLLRCYFSVDTAYVLSKLKILVAPFTHKNFKRIKDPASLCGSAPPRSDVNAPDLYIPTMALVTYIVLYGLHMGWNKSFEPEMLGKTASSGLTVMVLEVMVLKLGYYLLEGPPVSFLDFVCYSGYKYVAIVACAIAYIVAGRTVYYIILLALGGSMSYFMLKTVAASIIPPGVETFHSPQRNAAKEYFVLAMAAMQIPVCWIMGV